jgi:hypothetical protein
MQDERLGVDKRRRFSRHWAQAQMREDLFDNILIFNKGDHSH